MIGIILVIVSWALLRLEGKNLDVLGFNAPRDRLRQFGAGFLTAGLFVVVQQMGYSLAAGVPWEINTEFTTSALFDQVRRNINSVLYEELLFRGYLLYQMIRWAGSRNGTLLGAAVFGIYHWFSYGVIGNPVVMVYVFVLTGAFGLMCCLAFVHTRSIAAPIGLHLGWNLISYLIFSGGPFGPGVLIPANGVMRMEAAGWAGLGLNVILPLALSGIVCWYLVWTMPSVKNAQQVVPQVA